MVSLELSSLGYKLPIGFWTPNGERLREYSLQRYVGKHDLILGELEDTHVDNSNKYHRVFSAFLPQVIQEVEGYTLTELAGLHSVPPGRILGEFYLADILSLLLTLKLLASGSDIPLPGQCPCPEEVKFVGGKDTPPHDLKTVNINTYPDEETEPPIFRLQLQDPISSCELEITEIKLQPLKFSQVPLLKDESIPLDVKLLHLCSIPAVTPDIYSHLSLPDIHALKELLKYLNFGPEKGIDMDCPQCAYEWVIPLEYGINYEDFYFSLMQAPREGHEQGATSAYFNSISQFLCFGDQAPCSSLKEVLELTATERKWWIDSISEIYKRQSDDMKKSQSKSRR